MRNFLTPFSSEAVAIAARFPMVHPGEISCKQQAEGWNCLRPKGHSGIHVAHCGSLPDMQAGATWEDDAPTVTVECPSNMITINDLWEWILKLPGDVQIGIEPGGAALIAVDAKSNVFSLPIGEIQSDDSECSHENFEEDQDGERRCLGCGLVTPSIDEERDRA